MTILTFTFFITIISALSVFSGFDFASALEEASANNVSRKGHGRILDLGLSGRIIFSVLFVAVMIVLSQLSKNLELLNISARCVLIFLVVLNIALRANGVRAFKVFVVLWLGNLISSLKNTGFTVDDKNAQLFIVIQLVAFLLLCLGTVLGNLIHFYRNVEAETELEPEPESGSKKEDEDAESDSEDGSKFLATNKLTQWLKGNWEILIILIVAIAAIIMVVTL
jgi:membrane protein